MIPLDLNLTPKGFWVIDHDSGVDVVCYQQHFKKKRDTVICRKRDPRTKRFMKGRVDFFYLQYRAIFEACYEGERINSKGQKKGKDKSNNLHVECHRYDKINVSDYDTIDEMIESLEQIAEDLQDSCTDCLGSFGIEPYDTYEHLHFRLYKFTDKCYFDRDCGEDVND